MHILKQSTAASILVGPVLDSTGAAYTGAVIGDFNITKNGTSAAMASAATATHDHNGHYVIALTTGNTDTLGRLAISCNKSTYAMAVSRFSVLNGTTFDAIITNAAGGANGMVLALASNKVNVATCDTLTTYTGNTPQTGDAYARIGSAGAGLTALGDTRIAHLDVDVSSRSTYAGGAVASVTAPVTLPTIPTDWITATGIAAGALDGKGDWSTYAGGDTSGVTTLLTRLTSGRAGNLDNIDVAVSTRSTYDGSDTSGVTTLLARVGRTISIDTDGRVAVSIPGL